MYFYCICGKEGDLHVLLFLHLLSAPIEHFNNELALGFSNAFSASLEMITWLLSIITMVYPINRFWDVKQTFHSWYKSYFVKLYDLSYMLLDLFCYFFFFLVMCVRDVDLPFFSDVFNLASG